MTTPNQLRAKAAEVREAAERQVAVAERRALAFEAKADEHERRQAKRAAMAEFRRMAKEAAHELASLTTRRHGLVVQRDQVVKKQRQLSRARDSATAQAAALQGQITLGIESGSAPEIIAEMRAKQAALTSVGSEYSRPMSTLDGQVEGLEREIDALTYPIQHAEDEQYRYEELAKDPYEEAKRAEYEAKRTRAMLGQDSALAASVVQREIDQQELYRARRRVVEQQIEEHRAARG